MQDCQCTYIERTPIDHRAALAQHEGYCRLLRECGAEIRTLDVNRDLPDCTFVEDAAVVLDEVAVLCSMGTAARRGELPGIEAELRRYRDVRRIELPAAIEGGDVLRVGRTLLAGLSSRTNRAGIAALEAIVRPLGYNVRPVPVTGCLHLKTACTAVDDETLLVNPDWLDARLDAEPLCDYRLLTVPASEPWGANVLPIGGSVCLSAAHVHTAEMLAGLGLDVRTVDISEFAKAEGGVTCLSLLIGGE